jgi:hypothetical protein
VDAVVFIVNVAAYQDETNAHADEDRDIIGHFLGDKALIEDALNDESEQKKWGELAHVTVMIITSKLHAWTSFNTLQYRSFYSEKDSAQEGRKICL